MSTETVGGGLASRTRGGTMNFTRQCQPRQGETQSTTRETQGGEVVVGAGVIGLGLTERDAAVERGGWFAW